MKYGVPQGSVIGPLLFLIFISDLDYAIKNSTNFHFADDTCLFNIKQSIKEINKSVNKDLKSLLHWVNDNKISLYVTKTEVIFRAKSKVFDTDLQLKMCGKKLYLSHQVKYLGVHLHIYQLLKLVKAGIFSSIFHYYILLFGGKNSIFNWVSKLNLPSF